MFIDVIFIAVKATMSENGGVWFTRATNQDPKTDDIPTIGRRAQSRHTRFSETHQRRCAVFSTANGAYLSLTLPNHALQQPGHIESGHRSSAELIAPHACSLRGRLLEHEPFVRSFGCQLVIFLLV